MPTHRIILLLILLENVFAIHSQNVEAFIKEPNTMRFQKLYLHTDREFYFSGDTLWFAAYLVEGQSHIPVSESCNLYVDLIGEDGEIIKNEIFLIQTGLGRGWLSLSNSTELEGNYLLRAYTDYLKNFGDDAFFTKTIRISTVKNSFELSSSQLSIDKDWALDTLSQISAGESLETRIDVSFLPEGGFLLVGESNCVTFKATDKSGKGIPVSGTLLDEKKQPVLTFQSIYKGAGKFYFYPKAGETYTAQIGETHFELPEVKESGAKLKLVNQGKRQIQLVVQGKDTGRGQWTLVGMNRGRGLFYLEITRKKINSILKIDIEKLRSGINRLVLLDDNLKPVSERLVFISDNINHLQVRLNDKQLSTREIVQVDIQDTVGSEISFLSMAVVDENYLNATGVSQNMASYLLLDSELKGHIETPADYSISDDSLDSQTKLDLLMTINGWSNYIWNDLDKDSAEIKFEPQLGFSFQGQVKRAIGNKTLPEGDVTMMLFKNDSTTQIIDQPLDKNGNFKFSKIFFTDSASVFVQARNKRNKNSVQFEMELPQITPPPIDNQQLHVLQDFTGIPLSLYRQRYLNDLRLKEFYPNRDTRLIDEINVTARKPEPKIKTGTPQKNKGAYQLTGEMTAGSLDIVQYLATRVPGVYSFLIWNEEKKKNEVFIKVRTGETSGIANFFIDGYRYIEYDEARSYNISDIKTIEIISPPMSYAFGARAMWGAINLTFKTSEERALDRPLLGGMVEKIEGFASFKEFYSPEYTTENVKDEAPDFRNTLYWNPNLILGNGVAEVLFFTCDNVSRYKVLVEGISGNGQICLGSADFTVARFRNSDADTENSTIEKRKNTADSKTVSPESSMQAENDIERTISGESKSTGKNVISGTVLNNNGTPVEFATLYNLGRKTSCITDENGFFRLEAQVNDSIEIKHLNYKKTRFLIDNKIENFVLSSKDFQIEEVLVSPQFAFNLFNRSCENTWKTFEDENVSRAYAKCTRKLYGETVAQEAFLDLDIVQKKLRSYKKGEKTNIYRIQEKIEKNGEIQDNDFLIDLNLFYPPVQQIYWVDLPKQFNYLKKEESNFIKLILASKTKYDHKCNIEVIINKKDTTLLSFAMVKKDIKLPYLHSKLVFEKAQEVWDTIPVQKTYHYIKYDYSDGFGYLSEYVQGAVISPGREIEVSEHLKTYKNGVESLAIRKNRKRIFGNRIILRSIQNRYETEFWENQYATGTSPYDFNTLENLKIKD
ncbi:carboxypeptidase-like regulatory domain-containing protein [Maribellus maritimus]|uniref:carboxypeptidase-like regulatory domain-containing protein n=1 Tax=Maribellus maritimus TaxID=2870838 RepID=UPI001EEC5E30|nr:carboxypeptidase-like regulatory domain-containing protein [Maribellus maritimus]MCG6187418.1 carboxypeptidase-like regulatory domain-containing protein [Maribellus maritimus]